MNEDDQNIERSEAIEFLAGMARSRGFLPRAYDGGLTVICDAANRGGHLILIVLSQRYVRERDGVSGYMIVSQDRAQHLFNTHKPL